MNGWGGGIALALALGLVAMKSYEAGEASNARKVQDMATRLEVANANADTLKKELADANKKVLEFQAGGAADEQVKADLQGQGKADAAAGEARVQAAKTVTTSTDDVLRTYWEGK